MLRNILLIILGDIVMKFLLLATAFTFFAQPTFAMEAPAVVEEATAHKALTKFPSWEEVQKNFAPATTKIEKETYRQPATRGRGGRGGTRGGSFVRDVEVPVPAAMIVGSERLPLKGSIVKDPEFLNKTFKLQEITMYPGSTRQLEEYTQVLRTGGGAVAPEGEIRLRPSFVASYVSQNDAAEKFTLDVGALRLTGIFCPEEHQINVDANGERILLTSEKSGDLENITLRY
jgi:hypothetical protein